MVTGWQVLLLFELTSKRDVTGIQGVVINASIRAFHLHECV